MWAAHAAAWRDPQQVIGLWADAEKVSPELLRHRVTGAWWETIDATGGTLLVTREYENLVMALRIGPCGPEVTALPIPHPSGIAVDPDNETVYLASTRNPNQIVAFRPAKGREPRTDSRAESGKDPGLAWPLVPTRTWFLPGCLYLHDLARIGGALHANAVGMNAVVRLEETGDYTRVWHPRCIETPEGPIHDRNVLQLNSIAAGDSLEGSFFSASTASVSARRPGHRNFPVDRRGVIFSAATREPIVTGLTRPHSARLQNDVLWVDNSGYGEVGCVRKGRFVPVARLPGWTRGLCFRGDIAFVGTSRVLPRFRQYAPGLEHEPGTCGLHALEVATGRILGSIVWPAGNQIFAVEWVPASFCSGFPRRVGARRALQQEKALYYAFRCPEAPHGRTL